MSTFTHENPRTDGFRLSPTQRRLHRMEPGPSAHARIELALEGPLDVTRWAAAVWLNRMAADERGRTYWRARWNGLVGPEVPSGRAVAARPDAPFTPDRHAFPLLAARSETAWLLACWQAYLARVSGETVTVG